MVEFSIKFISAKTFGAFFTVDEIIIWVDLRHSIAFSAGDYKP